MPPGHFGGHADRARINGIAIAAIAASKAQARSEGRPPQAMGLRSLEARNCSAGSPASINVIIASPTFLESIGWRPTSTAAQTVAGAFRTVLKRS